MRLYNTPIKRKMTLVILLTSGVALLLAYLAFVTVELLSARNSMVRDLNVLAESESKEWEAILARK